MSELHQRPTAIALVAAIRHFLESVMDPATVTAPFTARVAANAARIVERELELGPSQESEHTRLLATLGLTGEAQLAAGIRSGLLDDRLADVTEVVRATIVMRLAVDHPGYDRVLGAAPDTVRPGTR